MRKELRREQRRGVPCPLPLPSPEPSAAPVPVHVPSVFVSVSWDEGEVRRSLDEEEEWNKKIPKLWVVKSDPLVWRSDLDGSLNSSDAKRETKIAARHGDGCVAADELWQLPLLLLLLSLVLISLAAPSVAAAAERREKGIVTVEREE
jgi:hypothetical protein